MTIILPPEIETRLRIEAERRGMDLTQCALQVLMDHLPPHPNQATLDLFEKWRVEDATGDPEEIARGEAAAEELMQNLARNRFEMEGPNARRLWPSEG